MVISATHLATFRSVPLKMIYKIDEMHHILLIESYMNLELYFEVTFSIN